MSTDKTVKGPKAAAGPEQALHVDHDVATAEGRDEAGGITATAAAAVAGVRSAASDAVEDLGTKAQEVYGDVRSAARGVYEAGAERMEGYADRSREAIETGRRSADRFVTENPLLVGALGLAVGLIVGSLLPRTRHEDRTLGRLSDDVRDEGMRYARNVAQRGRDIVEETVGEIREGVRQASDELREPDSPAARASQSRYQNH